jgi:hypothetical protein
MLVPQHDLSTSQSANESLSEEYERLSRVLGNFHQQRTIRTLPERRGFLETRVYPLLGYFPWRCAGCDTRFLMRTRGESKRRTPPE